MFCSKRNPFLQAAFVAGAGVAAVGAAIAATRALRSTAIAPGSVVFITGGSRGLGFAIASRFAQGEVRLVLVARNGAELQDAQARLIAAHAHLRPEDFHLISADLSSAGECKRAVSETMARFGRIDVLVNNAGVIEVGPIEAQSAEVFEETMRINFFAAFHTTWAALPHLREQKPLAGDRRAAVVNIASIGGKFALPHLLPYSAAKFALVGFSEGLFAELYGKGIQVTTVCPGLMRTGGEDHAKFVGNQNAERRWFQLAAKTPGVATTPEHAADRIFSAVVQGRAEITITPQAWLGARFAGIFPETLQRINGLTNRHILPSA